VLDTIRWVLHSVVSSLVGTGERLYGAPQIMQQGVEKQFRRDLYFVTWFCFVYDFFYFGGSGRVGIIFITILFYPFWILYLLIADM
jgi:hypothetical protein